LTADGKGFVGEVRVAKRELDKLTGSANKGSNAARKHTRAHRQGAAATRDFGESMRIAHSRALKYFGIFVGAQGISAATRGLIRHADSFTQIGNAVRLSTDAGIDHAATQQEIFDIAHRTRAPVAELADLYQKLTISSADLGASNEQFLRVLEGVGQALVINGTSAQQARGALLQFSQAMSSNIVRAEEFNSILEGAKPILIAVANNLDAAGGSVGKLRKLVIEGEVSSREFFAAFERGLPYLAENFEKADSTVGQGLVQIDNALTQLIGRMDETSAASRAVAGALEEFAEYMAEVDAEGLADALTPVVTVVGALAAAMLVGGATALTAYGLKMAAARVQTQWFALTATKAAARVDLLRLAKRTGIVTARKYATAVGNTSFALRGLGRLLALLAGPAGWAVVAGGALISLARSTSDAGRAASEYERILNEIRERNKSGGGSLAGLNYAERKARLDLDIKEANRVLEKAKAELADIDDDIARKRRPRRGIASRNNARNRAEARELEGERTLYVQAVLAAENRLRNARERRNRELYGEGPNPLTASGPQVARLPSPFDDAGRRRDAVAGLARIEQELRAPLERVNHAYQERYKTILDNTQAGSQLQRELLLGIEILKEEETTAIKARETADRKRAADEAAQRLTASGLPALAAARERQLELAAVTDLSAVALQRQAAKTRITEDVLEEFGAATQQVQQAIIAARLAIEQQESALERMAEAYQAITGNAAAYAQQLRDLNAAEQLALANAANSGAKPAEIAAQQADIANAAELERERLHTEQYLANHRNRWERQIRDAQGYRSAIEQAEDSHQKNLLGLQFANQPQIAAIAQRHSQTITALDRGEEVSAKKKFKFGLDLAQEGLSQAAQYSKKAWKLNQLASITSAVINTYEGITKALSALPPPFSFAAAAAVGAAGFAQVAAIRAQQPPQGFARGGIVDRPTFFTARGVPSGVAGEAGPEAILPLRRGPGGRLGVHAGGGLRPVIIRITIGDVHVQAEPGQQPLAVGQAVTAQVLEALAPAVRSVITNEQRPGGLLNRTDKTS